MYVETVFHVTVSFLMQFQLDEQCGFGQYQKENGDIPKRKTKMSFRKIS